MAGLCVVIREESINSIHTLQLVQCRWLLYLTQPCTLPVLEKKKCIYIYIYIACLRQECHNSKFGIFELLV